MAVKDLVSGVLAESITTSTTNILVTIAQSIGRPGILAFFPTPPFYITIMPKSPIIGVANRLDSEILKVTAVGNDQVGNAALTCVRGQRDTTVKAFSAGDIVTVGVYTDDAVLLGGTGTTETETPWIKPSDVDWSKFGIIAVTGTGNTITTSAGQRLPLDTISYSRGNFTVNNGIVIGDGISYVEISANVFYEKNTYNYGWAMIRKNNVEIMPRSIADCSGGYGSVVFSPFVIPVAKNDVITIHDIDGSMKIRLTGSYMCIKQIG